MSDWVSAQKDELRSDFLKLVLYELNNTVASRKKRMEVLQAAIDEFNHDNCHKHDQELELQADKILFQKIAYSFVTHKNDEEMGLLVCALEMVYRASRARVALSFQEIGNSILPLFIEMLRWSAARRKNILMTEQMQEEVSSRQPQTRSASDGSTIVSAGTFYTKGMNHAADRQKFQTMNTVIEEEIPEELPAELPVNISVEENFSSHFSPEKIINDGESLTSILKNDTRKPQDDTCPNTPLRSNTKALPDRQESLQSFPDDENNEEGNPKALEEGMAQKQSGVIAMNGMNYANPNPTKETIHMNGMNGSRPNPQQEVIDMNGMQHNTEKELPCTDATTDSDDTQHSPTSPMQMAEQNIRQQPPQILGPKVNIPFPSQPRQRHVRFSEEIQESDYVTTDDSSSGIDNTPAVLFTNNTNSMRRKVKERYTHPLAVLKTLKILRYLSRVLSVMVPMANFPGLLDELIFQMRIRTAGTDGVADSILRRRRKEDGSDNSVLSSKTSDSSLKAGGNEKKLSKSSSYLDNASAARMDAIATIVNLACAEENKIKLLNHPGLLDAVINIAEKDFIDGTREHASIVLMNLALAESNKVSMAHNDYFLRVILDLTSDEVINTRRYASATILSLAGSSKNIHRIVSFGKGKLLHILTRVLAIDDIEEVRINVAETFFNMVRNCTDIRTIELIGRHRDVMSSLSSTIVSDYSADVRAYCARTLEWLAADIHFGSQSHPGLLDALIEASMWTKTNCIVEAMKAQATLEENRIAMVERPGLLDALANLAGLHGVNDEEVRECALATIERLTKEPYVRKTMVKHEGIMTELTRATFSTNNILDNYEEHDKITRALMKSALKNLAKEL